MNKEIANKKRKETLLRGKSVDELITIILRKDDVEKKKDATIKSLQESNTMIMEMLENRDKHIKVVDSDLNRAYKVIESKEYNILKLTILSVGVSIAAICMAAAYLFRLI